MGDTPVDIAIIGAGIHGVGVAEAALESGYSAVVLEQADKVAQGTSSCSSKLIHGGLRYLEQFHFGLVRECLQERSFLLKSRPDLVKLRRFYIPVYRNSSRPAWLIRLGLLCYYLLGGCKKELRFRTLPQSEWKDLGGILERDLVKVFQYFDGQTDDAALCSAVMQSAQDMGAQLLLSSKVRKIKLENNHCVINYDKAGQAHEIKAKTVVNATGPWINQLLDLVSPQQIKQEIDLVQGSHIVLPINLSDGILYVESPIDQRPVFLMPWKSKTLVGTTESLFNTSPEQAQPTDQELQYLLDTFNHYVPGHNFTVADIQDRFSGLRVLMKESQVPNHRSRETVFLTDSASQPRLVSIYGGKLTSYRATARRALGYITPSLF